MFLPHSSPCAGLYRLKVSRRRAFWAFARSNLQAFGTFPVSASSSLEGFWPFLGLCLYPCPGPYKLKDPRLLAFSGQAQGFKVSSFCKLQMSSFLAICPPHQFHVLRFLAVSGRLGLKVSRFFLAFPGLRKLNVSRFLASANKLQVSRFLAILAFSWSPFPFPFISFSFSF